MEIKDKVDYAIRLIGWIWPYKEKISDIKKELLEKSEKELEEMLIKLESYYTTQEELDRKFIKDMDRLSANLDESLERAVDEQDVEDLLLD